jgi:hypothetical protein
MRPRHWLYTIPLRLRSLFQRDRVEQELNEEPQFHLEQQIAQEIAAGKTREEADRTALRAMEGNYRSASTRADAHAPTL